MHACLHSLKELEQLILYLRLFLSKSCMFLLTDCNVSVLEVRTQENINSQQQAMRLVLSQFTFSDLL